jgi:hypothetical protein
LGSEVECTGDESSCDVETCCAPHTVCENKDNSDSVEEKLNEIICICDEYKSEGWTWKRHDFSDELETKLKNLQSAAGNVNESSKKYLKRWQKRVDFFVHLHDSADDNTVDNTFFHRRVWRKVCRAIKRENTFMTRTARFIDSDSQQSEP